MPSLSLICKFAITHKNDAFDAKIVNTRLTKIFIAIFSPDERLPSSATLRSTTSLLIFVSADNIRRVVFDCLTKL